MPMQIRLAAFALMASPIAGKCGESIWGGVGVSGVSHGYCTVPDKNVKYFRNRNMGLQSDGDC